MMKKKFAMALVAAVAVAVLAVLFAACSGTGDVKGLYETLVELQAKEEGTTTVSAVELDHLSGAEVFVSGDALIAEIEDPDTYDIVYELWVGGTKRVYRGEERPTLIANWCWYVIDPENETVSVYTIDENVTEKVDFDGSYPRVDADGALYVNDEAFCEYDAKTETVTMLGGKGDVPTLDDAGMGIRYELKDVDIEFIDYVLKVSDKNGKVLRYVDLRLIGAVDRSDVMEILEPWSVLTNESLYLQLLQKLAPNAEDYDYYDGKDKWRLPQYKYDLKAGELSEIDLGFIFGSAKMTESDGAILSTFVIGKDKARVTLKVAYCNADMKVLYDLDEIMPGATEFDLYGDYLFISDGSVDRYYDSEGNLVGEYLSSGEIRMDQSGLFVKIKNEEHEYFSVSGEYLFTLGSNGASRMASVPGRLYYTEARVDRDGEPELDETGAPIVDFKVYDVAAGKHTTICSSDEMSYDVDIVSGVYITDGYTGSYSVYNLADGSELIDFETNDPTSVDFRNFGDDLLIEYTVTHRQGSVETDEMRYILIDVERQFN